jgi:hypothetical protein
VLPVRLAPTVHAHVPNAYVVDAVTGGNWEGTGVVPDAALGALGFLVEEREGDGREQR